MSPYDSVTLYCFSGTGNTWRVASIMAEAARDRAIPARVVALDASAPAPSSARPLIGVLGPTHGFTAPWSVIKFAAQLPRGHGAHAFVAFTRGGIKIGRAIVPGLEGTAAYLIALLLWLRGYRVRGVRAFDAPVNWLQVHPGFSPAAGRYVLDRCRPKALGFVGRILDGRTAFTGLLPLIFGLLVSPISLLYLLKGRFFLGQLQFANPRCNGCGLCADVCPRKAIRIDQRGRPYWTLRCESCMRCMAYCPLNAVEAGHSLGFVLYYAVLPGQVFVALYLACHSWWITWLAGYPLFFLSLWLGHRLLHAVMRIGAVNSLFTYTTFTHIFRRYHEPGTRLTELAAHRRLRSLAVAARKTEPRA